MKILIPNATGPNNLGDQAILEGLLSCAREVYGHFDLAVHSYNPERYPEGFSGKVSLSLHTWAVFDDLRWWVRCYRTVCLFAAYVNFRTGLPLPLPKELRSILADYQSADLILFTGGGYLRTRPGLRQGLNLFAQLAPFWFARRRQSAVVVAPISFGPFAYRWQERCAAAALTGLSCVSVRENISQVVLQKYRVPNVVFTCDTALLIPKLERKTVPDGRTIGFTIRSWFDNDERQNFFEESVANALATFVGESGYAVMPIVQVDAPSYGESDREPAERVCARLQTQGVQTLPIKVVGTVPEALNVYGSLVLLLGMRMHSNILAVTQGVPFVAISYEHKTLGIARMLDVDHYCLSVNEVNAENLLELLRELSANRAAVVGRTAHALAKLHRKCKAYWFKILEQHALR